MKIRGKGLIRAYGAMGLAVLVTSSIIGYALSTKWEFISSSIGTTSQITVAIISAAIGLLGITVIFLRHMVDVAPQPIYTSDVTIDDYGAKNRSAKWEYQFKPSRMSRITKAHWFYFNLDVRNIEDHFDLLDYNSIEFYIMGCIKDYKIIFTLFARNQIGDAFKIEQYYDGCNVISSTNWQKQVVQFSELQTPPWSEVRMKYKPGKSGDVFAFGFSTNTKIAERNIIRIDEVYLLPKDKNRSKLLISDFETLNANIGGVEGIWHAGWGHN